MSSMNVVAVDTNLLIYLQQADMPQHRAARALFSQWAKQGTKVVLPAPVAAEYLSGLSVGGRDFEKGLEKAHAFLVRKFGLLAFDEKASLIYARIMSLRTQDEVWNRMRKAGSPRRCLLADIAILATAEAHGIPAFYSGETRRTMRTLAERAGLNIKVYYLDELPLQYPMDLDKGDK